MMPRPRVLLGAVIVLAAIVLVASALGVELLRAAAGIPLALWVPGASLLLAIRPRYLTPLTGAVLALPISVAMLAVVGVALDRTSLGLTPLPLALGAIVPSIALLAVAEIRETRT